jgi:hypothetical protein
MLLELNLAVAQCATSYASKFAFLLTFRTDHEASGGIKSNVLIIMSVIRQS